MTGRYQAYPEYRNSGVEWLGDVPAHWNVAPIKYLAGFSGGGTPSKENPEFWRGDIPWVSPKDMKCSRINSTIDNVTEAAIEQSSTNLLAEGALLMVVRSGILQHSIPVAINNVPVTLNQDMKALRFNDRMSVRYAKDVITGNQKVLLLEWAKQGATVESVEQEYLANTTFPVPSVIEQNGIASFLDHETAKIDTLIEKQQQLIKLLKEKRQAVISHAVTKGLNPNAPMRDSGVEWLGEVPEHWDVKRLGLLFTESSARASSDVELEYQVLSVSIHHGISDKELNEKELDRKVTRSDDKSLYKVVHNNDLAYNMMRAWQGGFGASKLSGLVSPAYVVCTPKTNIKSSYFELVLRTSNAVTELKRYSRGITDFRLRLYWDEFKNICVPVPPAGEVDEILESIESINSKYDHLVLVADRQIELLKERRTALISAAVTGKIDVRGWQAPVDSCLRGNGEHKGNAA